jgi:hypothetical protein
MGKSTTGPIQAILHKLRITLEHRNSLATGRLCVPLPVESHRQVVRFDAAMDEALSMNVFNSRDGLSGDKDAGLEREISATVNLRATGRGRSWTAQKHRTPTRTIALAVFPCRRSAPRISALRRGAPPRRVGGWHLGSQTARGSYKVLAPLVARLKILSIVMFVAGAHIVRATYCAKRLSQSTMVFLW